MQKLVIFDTETTGLNEEDRIIQVGAIISEIGNPSYFERAYDELCSVETPIKIESMAVHGIRQEDIKDKSSFSETKFKKRFDELNSNENYLIAHNLDFDKKMIEKEGYSNRIEFKLIDTYQCVKHLYQIGDEINGYKLPNHKLQTFRYMMFNNLEEEKEAKKYDVEIKAHDAIGDVVILKMFLGKLFLKVKSQYKLKSTKEVFDKMVELSSLPVEMKIVPFFKKHPNKTVQEIDKVDPSYIDYFYKQQKEYKETGDSYFNKDLHFTLEKIVNNRNNNLINLNNEINF